MPRLPIVSGQDLVRALTQAGFEVHHQKGSHIILKQTAAPFVRLSVPNQKELRRGLLAALLRDAGITRDRLEDLLERR